MKNTKFMLIFALTAGFTVAAEESNYKNLRTLDQEYANSRTLDEEYAIKYEMGKKLQNLVESDEKITSDKISEILNFAPADMRQEKDIENTIEFANDLRKNKSLKDCYFQSMESMKQEIGATREERNTIREKDNSCNEMLKTYSKFKEANHKQE